jgi:hypothetical protein
LRFYGGTVSPEGKIQLVNLAPGRYWVLVQPAIDDALSAFPKFRIPTKLETRAKLHRDAEELKIEIELKPCQDLGDFKITVKPPRWELPITFGHPLVSQCPYEGETLF